MAPPGELRVKAGVVCWQVKLCDPHLSALEVRFSRRGAIQIDHLFYLLVILITHVESTDILFCSFVVTELTVRYIDFGEMVNEAYSDK